LIRTHHLQDHCEATSEFGAAAAWHRQCNEDRALNGHRSRIHREHARHAVKFRLSMTFASKGTVGSFKRTERARSDMNEVDS